jgi:signal transduction histidine kinase
VARDRTVGSAIVVEVTTAGNFTRLPRTLEDAAFRIGREAIANAVRHANPTRIEIHLELSTDTLLLEVRDNGRGMNPSEVDEARRQGHFGLAGIQNRAALLGGRCETRPRPGGGTLVVLELPLTQASASSHARL